MDISIYLSTARTNDGCHHILQHARTQNQTQLQHSIEEHHVGLLGHLRCSSDGFVCLCHGLAWDDARENAFLRL